jgi:ppGpp synthetase/RelA/SpoT-type nucleotidyltranferase
VADRLSKAQLDKLGERLRAGSRDETDLRLLVEYQHSFLPAYEAVWNALGHLRLEKPNARRLKTVYSIEEKLKRQSSRLTQIQDIAGVRLTCRDAPDQDLLLKVLSASLFPGSQVDDHRERPSYGYRAVHLIVTSHGDRMVEIQIRTRDQDRWAQVSERLAVQFGAEVKYGGGPQWVREALSRYSETVKACEPLEWQHWDMSHKVQDMKERTSDAATAADRERLVAAALELGNRVRAQRAELERELESIARLIEESASTDGGNDDLLN